MKNNYLFWLALIACLNTLGILYFFSESIERSDTPLYVQTIDYFSGKAAVPSLDRLVKPLSMMSAAGLSSLFGPRGALFAQNILCYFASIFLVFKIIEKLYSDKKQAFYGAIIFMTSFPMLQNALSFLTDMTGWFFLILVVYLALIFYQKPSLKLTVIAGLLSGIGFLFKESGIAGAVFLAFLLLFAPKFKWPQKIKYGAVLFLCAVLPVIFSVFLITQAFHYSYFDWYKANLASSGKDYNLQNIIQQLLVMFLLGWVFAIKGFLQEKKNQWADGDRKIIFLAMIPLFLTGFLWPMPVARVLFLGIMPLVILASYGLASFKKPSLEITLLALFVAVNYTLPNIFSIADLSRFLSLILPSF